MAHLLRRLIHEFGNGKAVANAAQDRRQLEQAFDAVDALCWRLLPAATPAAPVEERVAA